jgi:glutamyl-Q tRNA(Asp) synthetase
MYVGRFAPSPTGPLHFGSLVAALASWLDARAAGGRWRVRIEDLDVPRADPVATDSILRTLQQFRLTWDGPVEYQSRRTAAYEAALNRLASQTYWCACTRREIADSALGLAADGAQIYPGTCRAGLPAGKAPRGLRVRTTDEVIVFDDRVQGPQRQRLGAEVGDFVLARPGNRFTYQLAVVVDDAAQGVTDVVRGADLIESTARQIHLQRLLGYPTPRYLHVPAVVNSAGEKLSKQTGAKPVQGDALRRALALLGQRETDDLAAAVRDWTPAAIPRRRALAAAP